MKTAALRLPSSSTSPCADADGPYRNDGEPTTSRSLRVALLSEVINHSPKLRYLIWLRKRNTGSSFTWDCSTGFAAETNKR